MEFRYSKHKRQNSVLVVKPEAKMASYMHMLVKRPSTEGSGTYGHKFSGILLTLISIDSPKSRIHSAGSPDGLRPSVDHLWSKN